MAIDPRKKLRVLKANIAYYKKGITTRLGLIDLLAIAACYFSPEQIINLLDDVDIIEEIKARAKSRPNPEG